MKDLSRKQQAILQFIETFLEENDYPPTIRDIQNELGISSTSVVDYNLKALEARGVACAIAFKRQRGQGDLPPLLRRLNRMIARVRAVVEHPFAWMKNMGYRRARYRGRRRNEVDFALMLVAYNWKKSLSLAPAR